MTLQFKKFLLFLVSCGLGVIMYNLLYMINNPNKYLFGAPMVALIYVIISIVGVFACYHFFKKYFFTVK
ncbi:MAG: hypothetical protein UW07_C0036G0010 [Candidatus Nomurabacteria bacterium GW2011_GWF2_43_8]|uniref:Uncharacterized protein n=3 Tax=Candidatus Nomuraibacteriota TaxID=1752729 RepID=A0A0G1FJ96_9BACT|nr:MAG: hypothetical protein UV76_C0011G0024 [Candidatus Nomurabacteria bacterium GW2011_GWA2_43_15]KKT19064.1 MAG: hypothetical protein UW02_C0016G0038 [Candidatus Nomurabacteria bacterium GW2011_GWB1_43_7]KKT22441.1 MAG: hypothetical protein UW07_C0036G0010 [Candidatus Nomurabacteria bacterium GW2011_GWF2_43_8]